MVFSLQSDIGLALLAAPLVPISHRGHPSGASKARILRCESPSCMQGFGLPKLSVIFSNGEKCDCYHAPACRRRRIRTARLGGCSHLCAAASVGSRCLSAHVIIENSVGEVHDDWRGPWEALGKPLEGLRNPFAFPTRGIAILFDKNQRWERISHLFLA